MLFVGIKNMVLVQALLLLCIQPALGQKEEYTTICEICGVDKHDKSSPYTLTWKHEVPFIVASSMTLGLGFLVQKRTGRDGFTLDEINALNTRDILGFDRPSAFNNSSQAASYSDFFRSVVTFFPIYFLSNHYTKKDIGPLLAMSTEVFAITFGLTTISKDWAGRPRPFTYNPDVPLGDKMEKDARRSFFSGHTSHTAALSFFMAKVITDYHPNMKKGLKFFFWSFAATIPALTGYLRVKAGRHFPTDVMAGYAVGALVGYLVPHLHKKKERKSMLSWRPVFSGDYGGLSLVLDLSGRK